MPRERRSPPATYKTPLQAMRIANKLYTTLGDSCVPVPYAACHPINDIPKTTAEDVSEISEMSILAWQTMTPGIEKDWLYAQQKSRKQSGSWRKVGKMGRSPIADGHYFS